MLSKRLNCCGFSAELLRLNRQAANTIVMGQNMHCDGININRGDWRGLL